LFPTVLLGYPSLKDDKIRLCPDLGGILIRNQFFPHVGAVNRNHSVNIVSKGEMKVSQSQFKSVKDAEKSMLVDARKSTNVNMPIQDLDSLLKENRVKVAFTPCNLTLAPGECKTFKLRLKGVKDGAECFSLPEFDKVKGLSLSADLSSVVKGCIIVEGANALSNHIVLKKGEEITKVEVYKAPIFLVNSYSNERVLLINEETRQPLISEERKRKLIDKVNEIDFEVGKQQVLVIPHDAVAYRSEVTAVYVINQDGIPLLRQVRLGRLTDDDKIVVLAGLEAGEKVAIDPSHAAVFLKQKQLDSTQSQQSGKSHE